MKLLEDKRNVAAAQLDQQQALTPEDVRDLKNQYGDLQLRSNSTAISGSLSRLGSLSGKLPGEIKNFNRDSGHPYDKNYPRNNLFAPSIVGSNVIRLKVEGGEATDEELATESKDSQR